MTTEELRLRFGPERVEKLKLHELSAVERERFSSRWRALQSHFVDDPKGAVAEADVLVSALMQERGYPVADFSQRAADISVDHPQVVTDYRTAHEIALQLDSGEVSTEDLRTATIHYRFLVEELVRVPGVGEMKAVA